MMSLEYYLNKYFGYSSFRPGQKETIESLLQGEHTLAMLPTGTGKSVCYQLTAYILNKPVIIVSPLLSLMQDQAEQLKMKGEKRVISFNSFLSGEERHRALKNLSEYRFIFVSPEMLNSHVLLHALKKLDIGLFVIDEAHCISQWGYDFRPDYLKLGNIWDFLSRPLTLALTATATPEVREDIIKELGTGRFNQILSSVDRENIALRVERVETYDEKLLRLAELAKALEGPGIIYFSSKKAAETIAHFLTNNGIDSVGFYHGGMDHEQRILIQQQFIKGQLQIICATSAFGMGINKENVRFVIHFQMPMQFESFIQEIGRSGRDGKQSISILLYMDGDEGLQVNLIDNELPSEGQVQGLFHFLQSREAYSKKEILDSLADPFVAESYSVNEVQMRIIKFLLLKQENFEDLSEVRTEILSFVEGRKQIKMDKLVSFLSWIQSKHCRRESIAHYFNQVINKKPLPCCDNCGFNLNQLFIKQNTDPIKNSVSTLNWNEELTNMLMPGILKHEK